MLMQVTSHQYLIQVVLTAPRSYAATAKELIGKLKVAEFPSAEWSKGHALPSSPNYGPVSVTQSEQLDIIA